MSKYLNSSPVPIDKRYAVFSNTFERVYEVLEYRHAQKVKIKRLDTASGYSVSQQEITQLKFFSSYKTAIEYICFKRKKKVKYIRKTGSGAWVTTEVDPGYRRSFKSTTEAIIECNIRNASSNEALQEALIEKAEFYGVGPGVTVDILLTETGTMCREPFIVEYPLTLYSDHLTDSNCKIIISKSNEYVPVIISSIESMEDSSSINAIEFNSTDNKDVQYNSNLTHSIGNSKANRTILTVSEFCSRLTNLREYGKL